MAKGINGQLNDAVDPWLQQIRNQLATPPPEPPAAPSKPAATGWVAAKPTAADYPEHAPPDALARLDALIKALNDAAAITERDGNVARLALQMRACKSIADELGSKHKFDAIRLAAPGKQALAFGRIRDCIELASQYYERLAYYKTRPGKDFLRGVASVGLDLDREGEVAVRKHHFDERIDPLASLRHWDFAEYLAFAQQSLEQDADPLDRVVDFLIDKSRSDPSLVESYLSGTASEQPARLHPTRSVGSLLDVQVLTHVPGDDRFATPGQPRLWTYQVKIPRKTWEGAPDGWTWSAEAWSDEAISLPILRVVHTVRGPTTRHGIFHDFTRGTLYAMKGETAMRCFPSMKHHSALFAADVTSAAGMLVADDGRVVAIDNRSGHYQPGFQQLATAVRFLKSHLLFEPDSFVSVFVSDVDALYLEPDDFLEAAQRFMNYRIVADLVARRMRDYGHLQAPVAPRLADLIPPTLCGFPTDKGRNRWDRTLASYYGGLEAIVKELREALQGATSAKAPGWVSGHVDPERVAAHVKLAEQTLQAIDAGGAYCRLADLVGKLMVATQQGKRENKPLLGAHVRYRRILERLSTLTPQHGLL